MRSYLNLAKHKLSGQQIDCILINQLTITEVLEIQRDNQIRNNYIAFLIIAHKQCKHIFAIVLQNFYINIARNFRSVDSHPHINNYSIFFLKLTLSNYLFSYLIFRLNL